MHRTNCQCDIHRHAIRWWHITIALGIIAAGEIVSYIRYGHGL